MTTSTGSTRSGWAPRGLTLPWSARYSAYGIWVVLFVGVLFVEAVLPMAVSIPPVWELVLTILATYALTGVIDHDRPLVTVWHLLRGSSRRRVHAHPKGRCARMHLRVRLRENHVRAFSR